MKCNKCKTAERHGSLAYCLPCNSEYMKAYRLAKKSKQDEPVTTIEPIASLETVETPKPVLEPHKPYVAAKPVEPRITPVYWSFYVKPGTPFHSQMVEAEKVYQVVD